MNAPVGPSQRADKWLWHARVVKSRSLAQGLVKSGKVRVDGVRVSTPSRNVTPGETLTITMDRQIKVLEVVGIGTRRGPAGEAQTLYNDLTPPPAPRQQDATSSSSAPVAPREEGAGRPTKRERRKTDAFRVVWPDED